MRDQAVMAKLRELLSIDEADPSIARWKVKRGIERGEVVTIPDPPSSGLQGSRGGGTPRPRSVTFTPSQLFKASPRIASAGSYHDRPAQPRLFADDCMAAWRAKPGDFLLTGEFATAVIRISGDSGDDSMLKSLGHPSGCGSLLDDAQPFVYRPDIPNNAVAELAGSEGTPGNNQAQNKQFKAVVRALGLNQVQARRLHEEISKQGLGYHEMLERGKDMFGVNHD
ncbi:hypothetical protein [Caballeronia novacaledonica]|uniref:Uncharacterized protein n=1 Tax=Caballeronia novacaledonica TaxID=1544861 RepID=A0AA37ICV1_9BURK|nr:hypothetical protein [Caballeronia novacaledonica]GJH23930.1 hypothetical protein CBA19CS42_05460 [Caballeronia novacaledonica]